MSSPWLRVLGFGIAEWMEKRPLSKEKRAARKARKQVKRKQRKGEPLTADEQLILSAKEDKAMLEGKKTYLGIGTVVLGLVLGLLGIGQCDPGAVDCQSAETMATQLMAALDQIMIAGGSVLAAYGRKKAKPTA